MKDIINLIDRAIQEESAASDHGSNSVVETLKIARGEIERLRKENEEMRRVLKMNVESQDFDEYLERWQIAKELAYRS